MNEFKTDINLFLINNAVYIAISIAAIIFIALIIIFILIFISNKKSNQRNNKQNNYDVILKCLGGIDNIKDFSIRGSRLSLTLFDSSLLKDEEIKNYGIKSIINMSNKTILVLDFAKELSDYFTSLKSLN